MLFHFLACLFILVLDKFMFAVEYVVRPWINKEVIYFFYFHFNFVKSPTDHVTLF